MQSYRGLCEGPVPLMNATNCPFCGIVTNVPHNTQQGCIDALHNEIIRMRRLLEQVTFPGRQPDTLPPDGLAPPACGNRAPGA